MTSFTSAWSITYTWHFSKSISSSSSSTNGNSTLFSLPFEYSSSFSDIWLNSVPNLVSSVSCSISNLTNSAWLTFTDKMALTVGYIPSNSSFTTFNINRSFTFWEWLFTFDINNNYTWFPGYFSLVVYYSRPNSAWTISFDYSCVVSWDYIWLNSCPTCPTCPTCPSPTLQCDETEKVSDAINNVILYSWSVSLNNSSYYNIFNYWDNGVWTYCVKLSSSNPQTLTFGFANGWTTAPTNLYTLYNDQYGQVVCLYWNKPYFNAKLNSSSNTVSYEVYKLTDLYNEDICINNEIVWSDCSSIQESLSWCLEDNESLTNMNTSLNDQLQQCLVNWWTWCDPEVDSWCVEGATVYSLFWNQMWSDFSLPITNNLFLLSGMRAYSDSWVVSLWYIDSPVVDYSMDSDSSDRLINLVVWIFEILSWVIFVLVAWYYIKKFLWYVLFPYKK